LRSEFFVTNEAKSTGIAKLWRVFLTKYGEKIVRHNMCELFLSKHLILLCHFGGNMYKSTPNLAGSRLFMRSRLNKLDFFRSFWDNAKKYNISKKKQVL
jgi:hypothetical protein